jgi:hypothetical protein
MEDHALSKCLALSVAMLFGGASDDKAMAAVFTHNPKRDRRGV